MQKYESVAIINPTVEDEEIKRLIQKFSDLINKTGKVLLVEELGKKRLAYEIQRHREGYYVVTNFEGDLKLRSELEEEYKNTDEIIKFIVVGKVD